MKNENYSALIIDDNEIDRYILKRDLLKIGHKGLVFEKENGKQGLEFFEDYNRNKEKYQDGFPPLLVFLDINMPFMGGFEFLKHFSDFKENSDLAKEPSILVMFSSSGMDKDKEKALSYNFVKDYLVKGDYQTDELKTKIEGYLKEERQGVK